MALGPDDIGPIGEPLPASMLGVTEATVSSVADAVGKFQSSLGGFDAARSKLLTDLQVIDKGIAAAHKIMQELIPIAQAAIEKSNKPDAPKPEGDQLAGILERIDFVGGAAGSIASSLRTQLEALGVRLPSLGLGTEGGGS